MQLLTCPFDPDQQDRDHWPWRALFAVALTALAVAAAAMALGRSGGSLSDFGRPLAGGAMHAALLAGGWVLAAPGPTTPIVRLSAAMIAAALASHAHPWGAIVYLLVPIALVREARRRSELARIGFGWPGLRVVGLGLLAGAFLGVHLLVTASLTFGYGVRASSLLSYLSSVAYDAGANALTAEWVFRGALFSRWWRAWSFWPAAGASTACALLRYLADPNLPRTIEVALGAAFYVTLLGVTACALRARTASLLPGYAASLGFFAGYRVLAG